MRTLILLSVGLALATMSSSAMADPVSTSDNDGGQSAPGAPTGPPSVLQCAECPQAAQIEGEPDCSPTYVDVFNGGCNSGMWSPVDCSTICGRTGTWTTEVVNFRDTDWYRITVGAGVFTYTGIADGFQMRLIVIQDQPTPCPGTQITTLTSESCTESDPLVFSGPGTFYLFAGPNLFTGVPCGSTYRLSIIGPGVDACQVTPVAPTSWGALKEFYR
jgi:hypothetical protein